MFETTPERYYVQGRMLGAEGYRTQYIRSVPLLSSFGDRLISREHREESVRRERNAK